MKFVEIWRAVIESFGTQGGSLVLLFVTLLCLFPMLGKGNAEAWKAATFLLGVMAGVINSTIVKNAGTGSTTTATNTVQKTEEVKTEVG